ncbi:MAG TPA: response regulator [Gaiellaceae bacterium]|nr:response regulator [Gaiellaceae bacterium]
MFEILVVDDIAGFRFALTEALTPLGCKVVSAPNVATALQCYAEQSFDLIISDYSMPGGTGMDLLREVRRIERRQPFILMSADLPRGVAREAQLHGACVFEKHDAMERVPEAFAAGSGDPLYELFCAPHQPALVLEAARG